MHGTFVLFYSNRNICVETYWFQELLLFGKWFVEFIIHNFLLRKFLFCAEFFLILIAIDFLKMATPPSCFLASFSFISVNTAKLGKLDS